MKITICCSAEFINKVIDVREKLTKMKCDIFVPLPTEDDVKGITPEYRFDLIVDHFDKIRSSDAILVLNYDKDGVKNYIGPSVLMEMAVTFFLKKKIFLLNPVPESPMRDEVLALKPIILNGKLENIKENLK